MTINWNEIEEPQKQEPLKAGEYEAIISSAERKTGKASGINYMALTIKIGEFKIFENIFYNSRNAQLLGCIKKLYRALGLGEPPVNLNDETVHPNNFINKRLIVDIKKQKDSDFMEVKFGGYYPSKESSVGNDELTGEEEIPF